MTQPIRLIFSVALLLASQVTYSWSRPGHMVTGAIAHEELLAKDAKIIAQISELMSKHPDRGPFEVATGPARGEVRSRRLFMEMARWPDDIRGSLFDHPTWHYSGRALIDPRNPPTTPVRKQLSGAALEAYALNLRVAADKSAPAAERAVALCWIFHLTGDMHQPLHAVDQFAARFPEGDRGGGLQFVRESLDSDPESLHSYWDGIVHGNGESDDALRRAHTLTAKLPRTSFPQLATSSGIAAWAQESADIASKIAYRNDLLTGISALEAKPLSASYIADSKTVGERQLTLAGYRLADVLRSLFP